MSAPDRFAISLIGSRCVTQTRRSVMTWEQIVDLLTKPRRTDCTVATCATGIHAEVSREGKIVGCRHKDGPAWIPATFSSGRKKATVEQVSLLVVDGDHLPDDAALDATLGKLERYRYVAHATHSDKPGDRCARIVIPLSCPVPGADWDRFWPVAMQSLGMPADPTCCDAGRLYYLPARPSDADFWFAAHDGEALDVKAIIASAPAVAPAVASSLEVDNSGSVGEGQRHAMLKSLAGAMRYRGAGAVEIEAALLAANQHRCNPPKPESVVKEIAAWAAAQPVSSIPRRSDREPPPGDLGEDERGSDAPPPGDASHAADREPPDPDDHVARLHACGIATGRPDDPPPPPVHRARQPADGGDVPHPADGPHPNVPAERDHARPEAGGGQAPRKPYHRAPNLTRAILERARLPWVAIRLDDSSAEITRARVGAYLVLLAPEGSGKSSLLLQIGTTWARTGGVFIYFTVELDEEEAGGRVVGQCIDEAWELVLRGCVAEEAMASALDLPRFVIMAGEDARLDAIKITVEDLRQQFPDMPIVVGVDYLQAIDEGNEREERQRVSKVSKRLRKLAKELGVVIIGVSQTSRGNREKLRSGEAVGADTTAMGAESSQLERDAYVTLALGGFEDQPDGTRKMDLSVGKTRMGQGDKAYPVIYDGRSGRFTLAGPARSGSVVRAERASKDDETKVHAAMLAIPAALAQAPEPMFTEALAKEIDKRKTVVIEALRRLREDAESGVVKVRWQPPAEPGKPAKRSNGAHPHWHRDRAEASGVEIFPAGFGGAS